MQYRKKPIVVDAIRWTGDNGRDICSRWILSVMPIAEGCYLTLYDGKMAINTLAGEMNVSVGDWVIRGVAGELYPCDPAVFEASYEPAEQADDGSVSAAEVIHKPVFIGYVGQTVRLPSVRCTCGYTPSGPGDADTMMTMHLASMMLGRGRPDTTEGQG